MSDIDGHKACRDREFRMQTEVERLRKQRDVIGQELKRVQAERDRLREERDKYKTLWDDRQTMDVRLHRIEEAARRLTDPKRGGRPIDGSGHGVYVNMHLYDNLRAALEEEA